MRTVIILDRLPKLTASVTTTEDYPNPSIKDPIIQKIVRACLVLDKHKNIASNNFGRGSYGHITIK